MAAKVCKRCGTGGLEWRQSRKPPFGFYLVWPSDPGTVVLHHCTTVNGQVVANTREQDFADAAQFAATRAAAKLASQAAPQVQPEAPTAAPTASKATAKAKGKAATRTATDGGTVSQPVKVTLTDLPTAAPTTAAPTTAAAPDPAAFDKFAAMCRALMAAGLSAEDAARAAAAAIR